MKCVAHFKPKQVLVGVATATTMMVGVGVVVQHRPRTLV